MERYVLVAIGAALGGLARYIVGTAITQHLGLRFPVGTLVVNVTGCFVIGILMTLITARAMNPRWQPLLVVGDEGLLKELSSTLRSGRPRGSRKDGRPATPRRSVRESQEKKL